MKRPSLCSRGRASLLSLRNDDDDDLEEDNDDGFWMIVAASSVQTPVIRNTFCNKENKK